MKSVVQFQLVFSFVLVYGNNMIMNIKQRKIPGYIKSKIEPKHDHF